MWYVQTFGRPFRNQLRSVLKELGRRNGVDEDDPRFAALIYTTSGGVALFYAISAEVKLTTGVDPTDPAMIDSHAELLVKLFMSKASAKLAKQNKAT
jgi:hypothetical protein